MSADVLQEIVDEQRAQIAKLVKRIVKLTEEVSSVTEERRHAVAALSEQLDTVRAERDEANRESERLRKAAWERRNDMKPIWVTSEHHEAFVKLREQLASAEAERAHAVAALGEQSDRFRAERDEVRKSYCSLMEAYRGGDGRVTANKLGWGYLFPRRPKKEDGK